VKFEHATESYSQKCPYTYITEDSWEETILKRLNCLSLEE